MLCLILIVGGLLIMMGQHDRSEAVFYYFRLEDQIPEKHLLRLIDKYVSFECPATVDIRGLGLQSEGCEKDALQVA
jgi:hypothetical protein